MYNLFTLLLSAFLLEEPIKEEPLVWVQVVLFVNPFRPEQNGCVGGKSGLYNRERKTLVEVVHYGAEKDYSKCNCLCKQILVTNHSMPDPILAQRAETFFLSYFDKYVAGEDYPDVICLPEYKCIVTLRPNATHFTALTSMVDEIETGASSLYCGEEDYRGVAREKSTVCLYHLVKEDCRPPQSFLEKVVRDQREWFMEREKAMSTVGIYHPQKFYVESALQ